MAWDTSTVSLGSPTRKSDYDRLLDDALHLASGTATFNGIKIFKDDLYFSGSIATQISISGASRVRATQDNSQLITNATNVQMTFNNEDWDNLGEFASSTFTAAEAGYYKVSAAFAFASTSWVAGNLIVFSVYVNAAAKSVLYDQRIQANIANVMSGRGSDIVYLGAGDTLYVNLYISRTAGNAALLNNTTYNYINIHRLS